MTRLEAIQRIAKRAEEYYDRFLQRSPNHGEIPVGGAHIDEMANYKGLKTFLRVVCETEDPEQARVEAEKEVQRIKEAWNYKREWQVHRATGLDTPVILWALMLWCFSTPDVQLSLFVRSTNQPNEERQRNAET